MGLFKCVEVVVDCECPVRTQVSPIGDDENFPKAAAEYTAAIMMLAKVCLLNY